MVQSKGRAIVRKRRRDRGFAANADCRRRHARGVLIHRRITIGNAIARHRAALAEKRMRTARNGLHGRAARTTRVIAAACGQAGRRDRGRDVRAASRVAAAKSLLLRASGTRFARPRPAESRPPNGRVSDSIRFATAAAVARSWAAGTGKSLTAIAAPRTSRTRPALVRARRSPKPKAPRAGILAAAASRARTAFAHRACAPRDARAR